MENNGKAQIGNACRIKHTDFIKGSTTTAGSGAKCNWTRAT